MADKYLPGAEYRIYIKRDTGEVIAKGGVVGDVLITEGGGRIPLSSPILTGSTAIPTPTEPTPPPPTPTVTPTPTPIITPTPTPAPQESNEIKYLQQIKELPPDEREREWQRMYGTPYSLEDYESRVRFWQSYRGPVIRAPTEESKKIGMLEIETTASLKKRGYQVEEYKDPLLGQRRKITTPEGRVYDIKGEYRAASPYITLYSGTRPTEEEVTRIERAATGLGKIEAGKFEKVTPEERRAIREMAAEELKLRTFYGGGVQLRGIFAPSQILQRELFPRPAEEDVTKLQRTGKTIEKEIAKYNKDMASLESEREIIKELTEAIGRNELVRGYDTMDDQIEAANSMIASYNEKVHDLQLKYYKLNPKISVYNMSVKRAAVLGSPEAEKFREYFFPTTWAGMIAAAELSPIERVITAPLTIPSQFGIGFVKAVTWPLSFAGIQPFGEEPSAFRIVFEAGKEAVGFGAEPQVRKEAEFFATYPEMGAAETAGETLGYIMSGKALAKLLGRVGEPIARRVYTIREAGAIAAPRATAAFERLTEIVTAPKHAVGVAGQRLRGWGQDIYVGMVKRVEQVTGKTLFVEARPGIAITGRMGGIELEKGPWTARETRILGEATYMPTPLGETVRVPYLELVRQQQRWWDVSKDIGRGFSKSAWEMQAGAGELRTTIGGISEVRQIPASTATTLRLFGAERVGPTLKKVMITKTMQVPQGYIPSGGLPPISPTAITAPSRLFFEFGAIPKPTILFPLEKGGPIIKEFVGAGGAMLMGGLRAITPAEFVKVPERLEMVPRPEMGKIPLVGVQPFTKPIPFVGAIPSVGMSEIAGISPVQTISTAQIQQQIQRQLPTQQPPLKPVRQLRTPFFWLPKGAAERGGGVRFELPRGFGYKLYKHPLGDITELVWGKPGKKPVKLPIAFLGKAPKRRQKR